MNLIMRTKHSDIPLNTSVTKKYGDNVGLVEPRHVNSCVTPI